MPGKIYFLLIPLLVTSCSIFNPIPQPKREFRGFWVATVVNIDWPKSGKDTLEKQKEDYLNILDFYKDLSFNAAIVQVRAAGDAFYESRHAPWSRFLSGQEGKAPGTDILEWMIEETHKRGMEFHAWLNPYRATFDLNTEILSPTHDYYLHPEWMIRYGKKYYYNPGLPQVRKHLVSLMEELVTKYEIDAIHFDDYFYPYKVPGEVFNDSLSYASNHLGNQSLEDWRRSNVDSLIKNVHRSIKSKKPWIQFGVSPFGVWKNKSTDPRGSDTKAGQTTYEDLYADPLLWMEKGWIDYLVPQVYWSMELPVASHSKIVDWWSRNTQNSNLYIGNGAYKIRNNSDEAWNRKKELPDQLSLARKNDVVAGNVLFSAKSLMQNNLDVVDYLKKKYYALDALTPISPWANLPPKTEIPIISTNSGRGTLRINLSNSKAYPFLLCYASGKKADSEYPIKKLLARIYVGTKNQIEIDKELVKGRKHIALTFLDRFGRESEPIVIHLDQTDRDDSKR
ncbi:family 10 glycosylhydrolase [Ulvibacterium sp.]|uniref:glycoside hydrolase family 10 protein n=1 Tax=Ulvibacterium sp. TaxID=2665914 RepID=UPI0026205E4E|nr:family 10 glycosylhydrolase [Ulvibacterium sp.]